MTMISSQMVRQHLDQFLDHFSNLTSQDRYCRFSHTMSPDAIRDWLLKLGEDPHSHYFFIEEHNNQFIGISQLSLNADRTIGEIGISVHPDYRGMGISQKMIKEIFLAAKDKNLSQVGFQCELGNTNCKKLFTNLGFTINYDSDEQCIKGFLKL